MDDNSTDRDINILLQLDTYQGMTDSEIDSIIDYRIQRATETLVAAADIAYDNGYNAAIGSANVELCSYTQQLLETLCNTQPVLEQVVYDAE